jgi:aryl-alcohol dehydrogenase-like predicted oxidoreductase
MPPPEGLAIGDLVTDVAGLIDTGRARAWGIGNWSAADLAEAVGAARSLGVPLPVAAQLPYSVAAPGWVDDQAMQAVLDDADIGLVASFVLAGGTLTGKYLRGEGGRATADGTSPEEVHGRHRAETLVALADGWGLTPTSLAFSFALAHPRLASVLFGATSPEQIRENVASLETFRALTADQLERLRQVAAAP